MTISISEKQCNLCNDAVEPLCMMICPGDLFYKKESGQVAIRYPDACWDCASCVKLCPKQAISMSIPVEAGGRGSKLSIVRENGTKKWVLYSSRDKKEIIPFK